MASDPFVLIPDAVVVLKSKGVFRPSQVYAWRGSVYAKHGSGFIKIQAGAITSHKDVSWMSLEGGEIKLSRTGSPEVLP
jgi:hypothetical protein